MINLFRKKVGCYNLCLTTKLKLLAIATIIVVVAIILCVYTLSPDSEPQKEVMNKSIENHIEINGSEISLSTKKYNAFSSHANEPTEILSSPTFRQDCRNNFFGKGNAQFKADYSERQKWFAYLIEQESNKHGLNPSLFLWIVMLESRFHECVGSPKGAIGLSQVMPFNAKACGMTIEDLHDPVKNIKCGFKFYKSAYEHSVETLGIDGDPELKFLLAAAEYNAGRAKAEQYAIKVKETREYSQRYLMGVKLSLNAYYPCNISYCIRALKKVDVSKSQSRKLIQTQKTDKSVWYFTNPQTGLHADTMETYLGIPYNTYHEAK